MTARMNGEKMTSHQSMISRVLSGKLYLSDIEFNEDQKKQIKPEEAGHTTQTVKRKGRTKRI